MRELKFIEKIFSLVSVWPNKKQLTIFGKKWIWDRKDRYAHLPIQKNKVVFWAFSDTFTCNPKYIALSLLKYADELDIVWVSVKQMTPIKALEGKIRFVYSQDKMLQEMATAKVIVVNVDLPIWALDRYRKREGQFYINTWHGSMGIKKIGFDQQDNDKKEQDVQRMMVDVKNVDFIPSNSKFATDVYSRRFMGHGVIAEIGHPRNDVFFQPSDKKLSKWLALPESARFVMYAPTWHEDGRLDCFNLDPMETIRAFEKRFGGQWFFLSRVHPRLKGTIAIGGIDVSSYPDIQELMAECDALITDYSSVIYDFVLSRKPGFIFAPDYVEYESERGFYYPLSETPFPISTSTAEMVQRILDFDDVLYQQRVTEFLKARGCREDGHASERIARLILDIVQGKKLDFSAIGQAAVYN